MRRRCGLAQCSTPEERSLTSGDSRIFGTLRPYRWLEAILIFVPVAAANDLSRTPLSDLGT